jgi:hypothetical protein
MTIEGYQFDRALVTSDDDSSLYNALANGRNLIFKNRGNGLNLTANGLTISVDTGSALIMGKLVNVTSTENVAILPDSSGYLVISIDLTQLNESTGEIGTNSYEFTNNQLSIEFVNNLTQQDLNNGGLIYHFLLATVESTASKLTFVKNDLAYRTVKSNLDRLTEQGLYKCSGEIAVNSPYDVSANYLLDVSEDSEIVLQKSIPLDDGLPPYFRTKNNNIWTEWKSFI